jgi:hypothetical protein
LAVAGMSQPSLGGRAVPRLDGSYACSNRRMGMRRPVWWNYPEQCQYGHEWGPGLITVNWSPCTCAPAVAARGQVPGAGHLVVGCDTPGCRSRWYEPRHEPEGD